MVPVADYLLQSTNFADTLRSNIPIYGGPSRQTSTE